MVIVVSGGNKKIATNNSIFILSIDILGIKENSPNMKENYNGIVI